MLLRYGATIRSIEDYDSNMLRWWAGLCNRLSSLVIEHLTFNNTALLDAENRSINMYHSEQSVLSGRIALRLNKERIETLRTSSKSAKLIEYYFNVIKEHFLCLKKSVAHAFPNSTVALPVFTDAIVEGEQRSSLVYLVSSVLNLLVNSEAVKDVLMLRAVCKTTARRSFPVPHTRSTELPIGIVEDFLGGHFSSVLRRDVLLRTLQIHKGVIVPTEL